MLCLPSAKNTNFKQNRTFDVVTVVQLKTHEIMPWRQRCYDCYRPVQTCFCDAIPEVANQVHILILQHVKERFHAFNTARIVRKALKNCSLITDQTSHFNLRELPLRANTGVLYPGADARLLSDVPSDQRPEQLIILDGTWHHAKTIMRQVPLLQTLPRYCLQPAAPSNYRIRKEPTEQSLSTLEAVVQSLQMLEPETRGLQQLVRAFDSMVDTQIHQAGQTGRFRSRRRPWTPPANVPGVLIDCPESVVVVYGEAAHGPQGIRCKQRSPVYWVAQRLVSEETFECGLLPCPDASSEFLNHLELTSDDFANGLSLAEFAEQWRGFLRPNDTIAAFNQSTLQLLQTVGIGVSRSLTFKAVDVCPEQSTLDQKLQQLNLSPGQSRHRGRAGRRLANAVCYAQYLHHLGSQQTER